MSHAHAQVTMTFLELEKHEVSPKGHAKAMLKRVAGVEQKTTTPRSLGLGVWSESRASKNENAELARNKERIQTRVSSSSSSSSSC